eukprot:CAMPEP_0114609720 /NCGR_PEP_ID=MMETSP0168-20121206/3232_1 /TAXON_ID=95228 ORGANISM="Vannella sp., Strain DIVA3 517/6/12" /NCGR_SAMPLE_ID=MMETSP0168 /ASSEMBLY_ACC=CAM_ASM_000044 /LENGTH=102 /DNA_ID=CAMNT_0001820643 /DNA_START=208 /DNA_END=513 /DNA_ORIENTATION=-
MQGGGSGGAIAFFWVAAVLSLLLIVLAIGRPAYYLHKMHVINSRPDDYFDEESGLLQQPDSNQFIQQTECITPYPKASTLGGDSATDGYATVESQPTPGETS